MSTNGSLPMSHSADSQKSEKTCKAFKDISQYFSKKEWEKLEYSEKITYVYMKRNYTTMTKLGIRKGWAHTTPVSSSAAAGASHFPLVQEELPRQPLGTLLFSVLYRAKGKEQHQWSVHLPFSLPSASL
uniref:KRAB-related domain-containing protein n=1 Tax=Oryctolagus cuniculus TaxID=9986 RepID=G1SU88_RABIT